jgi:lactate dehydrogenase-like 2-hydroxyacid dehydrogenase
VLQQDTGGAAESDEMFRVPTLLVTCALPDTVVARAARYYRMTFWDRAGGATLAEAAGGADAVLCAPSDRVDAACIAALPGSVRVLATFSVGTDHIDLAAARGRGLAVVNTPGVLSAATAEFTMMLLLEAARRAGEGERRLRAGLWRGWAPAGFLGTEVNGKRLGIFGMGRIGQALASMARGFAMQVHYRNRSRLDPAREAGAIYHDNDASFLRASQFLALLAPGGETTRHWLNADRLAQLPAGAIVVNTARGTLVEDDALIAALRSGHVAAAGLDVFADEPNVPAGYLDLECVVLTPHIASATSETRAAMGHLALDGIAAVLGGRKAPNLVP